MLTLRELEIALAGKQIIDGLDLNIPEGQIAGLLGPNGSGKSTVVRTVYGAVRPYAGAVLLDGNDLSAIPKRSAAQRIGALAQDHSSDFDFTVAEIVAMGRTPHLPSGGRLGARDRAICEEAVAQMDVAHLWDRGILNLSGGERQRVMIARALAQEPALLVLDEPTNHLDPSHQVRLAATLRESGITVLLVLHDLNLAAAICDRIYFLRDGGVVAAGTPSEVIRPDVISQVFEIDAAVVHHPVTGAPQVLPTIQQNASAIR